MRGELILAFPKAHKVAPYDRFHELDVLQAEGSLFSQESVRLVADTRLEPAVRTDVFRGLSALHSYNSIGCACGVWHRREVALVHPTHHVGRTGPFGEEDLVVFMVYSGENRVIAPRLNEHCPQLIAESEGGDKE